MFQQFDTRIRDAQGSSENERADGVRRNDYRNESQKGIVDERAAIDCNFVEAENERHRRGHDRVETKEGGEGDENSDGKSKRRSLRWIIQREQTAKGRTKHASVSGFESQVSSC